MSSTHPVLLAAPRARWLIVAFVSFFAVALQAQTPLIFTHTKAALPGDVVVLHGANFVQGTALPEVWLDQITGSADTPNTETLAPEILSYSEKLIHVRVPASLPKGLYALFVKCNGSTSSHIWLNRADAWQALDLAGTQINPGRAFRLYGWNLDLPGATPQVWFKNTATNALTAATVTNVDRTNFLTLTAPASLTPGQNYQLVVSNGYGGTYGETTGPTLACVATPADALNLGVPWADEFAFATTNVYNVKTDPRLTLHAVSDGVTDDRPAIQAACDAATAAGGGCVYFPAGTYNLGATVLKPKQRVVLRGAGMNLTTLVGTINPHMVHSVHGTTIHNGTLDLTLTGGQIRWNSGGMGPVIVARVRVDTTGGAALDVAGNTTKVLVKDCELIARAMPGKYVFNAFGSKNLLMKNCYVQWSDGRIYAGSASDLQIENSTFARTVATDGGGPYEYGGWAFDAVANLAFIDNTFQKIGSGVIPDHNDGEAILNQAVPRLGAGQVTGATATTLTDSTESWTANELTTADAYAVIVSGPGEGQWRKIVSHTATTVTLDSPWAVTPTTASAYTITASADHWLIAGNTFNDCKRTIMLYSCTMRDVAIVDNDLVNCFEINLRSDQRLADTPRSRFNVFRNVLIQGNELTNTNHVYATQLSFTGVVPAAGETRIGNGFWDVVVRGNALDTIRPNLTTSNSYGVNGEGYFAWGVGAGASLQGTQALKGILYDRNYALDLDTAFNTRTGAMQTTIWKPVTDNVGALHGDTLLTGATQGALGTTVIPESRLYLHTWSPRGNISTDLDPISPPAFFDWLQHGTGTVTADTFSGSDVNTGSAQASGDLVRFTIPAGFNHAVGNGTGPDNFKDVLPFINALPAGTYTIRFSFDHASNHTDARNFQLLLYSANANKDSGGNDRWETTAHTLVSTNNLNSFTRRTADYTFTLVNPSATVPRPEGSFEIGKFSGFRLTVSGDARQSGDPTLILRMDNLALDLL